MSTLTARLVEAGGGRRALRRGEAADLERALEPELRQNELRYILASRADGEAGASSTGVNWWRAFTSRLGVSEEQSAPRADAAAAEVVEALLIRFATWLLDVRGVSVETVRKYLGQLRAWHELVYGEMTPGYAQRRLGRLLRGMERVRGLPPRRPRHGVRPQELASALRQLFPRPRCGVEGANARAALTVAVCGLFRAAELALEPKQAWDAAVNLTRGDVLFRRASDGVLEAVIMMRPCKKLRYRGSKTVPVVLRDGSVLQPVTELARLFRIDAVAEEELAATPLFRRADGTPFTTAYVRGLVKLCMHRVGRDPALFGAHSLRIGGASALLAAGVPPAAIQVMGRWDSDVYLVYCRWSEAAARRVGAAVASTAFTDFEGEFSHEEFV